MFTGYKIFATFRRIPSFQSQHGAILLLYIFLYYFYGPEKGRFDELFIVQREQVFEVPATRLDARLESLPEGQDCLFNRSLRQTAPDVFQHGSGLAKVTEFPGWVRIASLRYF